MNISDVVYCIMFSPVVAIFISSYVVFRFKNILDRFGMRINSILQFYSIQGIRLIKDDLKD